MTEIFKDIPYYDGMYQISNLGRVYSKKSNRFLAIKDNGRGYQQVQLWKNNKGKHEYIHRLVALAFIPNPDNLPQVNHKDEDKLNNCVDNLEWCDCKYNNNYGTARERGRETLLNRGCNCTKVNQYDLDGNYIATYRSMREAERVNGLANGSLSATFKNNYKQWGGYIWKKAD